MKQLRLSLVLTFLIAQSPTAATAYCRTTTCDPSASCHDEPDKCCHLDSQGCDRNGLPLTWPTSCVSFAIEQSGSPLREISFESARDIVQEAMNAWLSVTCDGARLSLAIDYFGAVSCNRQEYNSEVGNANVWMFRDDTWRYDEGAAPSRDGPVKSGALAITTVSFNWRTGELYDADVEFNSNQLEFSLGDVDITNDLLSIATHEAGHFLGLDHSADWQATMTEGYIPGSTNARSLSFDDEAAICAAYPSPRETKGDDSCEPRGGFRPVCADVGGCACDWSRGRAEPWGAWAALLTLGWAAARRRASRQPR